MLCVLVLFVLFLTIRKQKDCNLSVVGWRRAQRGLACLPLWFSIPGNTLFPYKAPATMRINKWRAKEFSAGCHFETRNYLRLRQLLFAIVTRTFRVATERGNRPIFGDITGLAHLKSLMIWMCSRVLETCEEKLGPYKRKLYQSGVKKRLSLHLMQKDLCFSVR